MSDTVPTVTLAISGARMQHVLSGLTTFLLGEKHAFLQTFHGEQRTDFEIFLHPQRPAVRLTLRVMETAEEAGTVQTPAHADTAPAETARLLQRLLDICAP